MGKEFNLKNPLKNLNTSFVLSAYPLFSTMINLSFYVILYYFFKSLDKQFVFLENEEFFRFSLYAFLIFFITKYHFTHAIFMVLKGRVNLNTRITVFRNYSEKENLFSRIIVVLAAYGRIQILTDNQIRNESRLARGKLKSVLLEQYLYLDIYNLDVLNLTERQIFVLFENGFKTIENGKYVLDEQVIKNALEEDEQWKYFAKKFINKSDFVVFIVQDKPTENVLWEIMQTMRVKYDYEVLIILDLNYLKEDKLQETMLLLSRNINLNENLIHFINKGDFILDLARIMRGRRKLIEENNLI
ncbi:hypothetical protein FK220_011605 [Flavobacteriaceae bacterium TP-CH-4]|uniref:Uncharacterized protein n=1 Tax=Pelagihabitans pacificus TaxID=2696054 RepID=A0A967ATA7_9FLAO|nr:hypothetical protein [Pelagihabitans pacificus]NHF59991.1 hypothetical protein [Pelagihabitans pacificus]